MKYLNNSNVLFLNDNEEITKNMVLLLSLFVKKVFLAIDSKKAFRLLIKEDIHLIIIDSNLKNECGINFIKELRLKDKEIPIILISDYKNDELLFRVSPLRLSGYIMKPITYNTLMESLDNCKSQIELNQEKLIELKKDFIYDKSSKQIIKQSEIYKLTKKEILFFEMLCTNKEKIISREMMKQFIYNQKNISDKALNNFIWRIRKKFGKDFLITISNSGYKIIN